MLAIVRVVLVLTGIFLVTAANAAPAARETAMPEVRTLRLNATGSVSARPDRAQISVGVVSEAKTARAALDANTAAMSKIVAALKEHGIEDRDIQTSDFSVHPKYEHFKDGNKPPVISGYRVVNSVRITVRDLKSLGEVLDRVVSFEANSIGGISFSISDAEKLADEARREAMANAWHKAELYAQAAHATLGRVIKIEEAGLDQGPRPVFAAMRAEAKSADVPIEPGESKLQVGLTVVWELVDKNKK